MSSTMVRNMRSQRAVRIQRASLHIYNVLCIRPCAPGRPRMHTENLGLPGEPAESRIPLQYPDPGREFYLIVLSCSVGGR
jgi:hypothetical protein